jgi:hypothetical protein
MIALYNLEPKYFNLALEKIRKYYEERGEKVDDYKPLWHNKYDKIYCSSIFTWTDKSMVTSDMVCGGTGFDLTTTLPSEIEKIKVYKNKGFTTRGCIRKCPFCVVPQKEGYVVFAIGDIYDLWNRKAKQITLYDNNILALPKHFKKICQQAQKENLQIDFNQGLDIKLLTDQTCQLLKQTKIKILRFAWDQMKSEKIITRKVELLKKYGFKNHNQCMIYMLIGFNTTFKEDMYRRNKINEWGYDAFVMIYNKQGTKLQREFARWNNRFYFRNRSFEDYLKTRKLTYLLTQQV